MASLITLIMTLITLLPPSVYSVLISISRMQIRNIILAGSSPALLMDSPLYNYPDALTDSAQNILNTRTLSQILYTQTHLLSNNMDEMAPYLYYYPPLMDYSTLLYVTLLCAPPLTPLTRMALNNVDYKIYSMSDLLPNTPLIIIVLYHPLYTVPLMLNLLSLLPLIVTSSRMAIHTNSSHHNSSKSFKLIASATSFQL